MSNSRTSDVFAHRSTGSRPINAIAGLIAAAEVIVAVGSFLLARVGVLPGGYWLAAAILFLALVTLKTVMIASQWEKAIVLRLGKLRAIKGPGLFLIIPFIEEVAVWIDQRIQTTEINAEQALTRDTVPVNVDAIVFWQVHDTERAALEIVNYRGAIERVAQTTLREAIGSTPLSALLAERQKQDQFLRDAIGRKTADWGVAVISVEIRDVSIPDALQDAMSRQAQAEREMEARVILGSAEQQVAQKFLEAAETYGKNPVALQLRAMNIIYETTKERGATILIPSSMVDSMNVGGVLGMANAASPPKDPAQPWSPPKPQF